MEYTRNAGPMPDGSWGSMYVEHDFRDVFEVQSQWSDHSFGDASVRDHRGPLDHLRKEIAEIEANSGDVQEFADGILLLFDAARRAGHNYQSLLNATVAKLNVNQRRKWQTSDDPTKAVEHVRE